MCSKVVVDIGWSISSSILFCCIKAFIIRLLLYQFLRCFLHVLISHLNRFTSLEGIAFSLSITFFPDL